MENRAEAVYQRIPRALQAQSDIVYDDLLRTGPDSRLQATLLDGSQITLGAHASLLIDTFVYAPATTSGALSLSLIEGAFKFVSGQIKEANGDRVDIATPIGVIGIRGTTFWMGNVDGGYGVLAIEGTVTVNARGGRVTLRAGEGTTLLDIEDPPGTPQIWPDDKVARALATVGFE